MWLPSSPQHPCNTAHSILFGHSRVYCLLSNSTCCSRFVVSGFWGERKGIFGDVQNSFLKSNNLLEESMYYLETVFLSFIFFFFDSRKDTLSSLSKVFCQKKSPLFYLIWIPSSKRICSVPKNGTPKRMSAMSSVLKQFLTVNILQITHMLHICKKWVGSLIFLKINVILNS